MILNIRGYYEYSDPGLFGNTTAQLQEVDITSRVYSKKQARAEFERFLSTTNLSDLTTREIEQNG